QARRAGDQAARAARRAARLGARSPRARVVARAPRSTARIDPRKENRQAARSTMTLPTPSHFRFALADDGGATITLDRPRTLNSLTFESYAELRDFLPKLSEEDAVRAVVISGEGKGFCSGGDREAIIAELFARDMKGLLEFTRMTGALIRNLRRVRRP